MTPEQEQQIRVLWEETPQSGKEIGAQFGVTGNAICALATRRKWVSFNPSSKVSTMTPDQEEQIRGLWENTFQSGSRIAAVVGVTKSAVVGLADRRGWVKYGKTEKREPRIGRHTGPPPHTIFDRLDALNAKLDRVLAETEPAIRCARAADAETLRVGERGGPVGG